MQINHKYSAPTRIATSSVSTEIQITAQINYKYSALQCSHMQINHKYSAPPVLPRALLQVQYQLKFKIRVLCLQTPSASRCKSTT